MRITAVLSVLLTTMTSGCEHPLGFHGSMAPGAPGELSVAVQGRNLVATNRTGALVHYRIWESETAPLVFWGPCTEGPECTRIEGGATLRSPFEAIGGYRAGSRSAILYWWHVERAITGVRRAGTVRSVQVDLH
jgi:hypothetical protein